MAFRKKKKQNKTKTATSLNDKNKTFRFLFPFSSCAISMYFSPIDGKDIAEMDSNVDKRRQTEAQHGGVFTVKQNCTINDV